MCNKNPLSSNEMDFFATTLLESTLASHTNVYKPRWPGVTCSRLAVQRSELCLLVQVKQDSRVGKEERQI
jgi:hypothetical protein